MMMIINNWSWLMKENILAPDDPLSWQNFMGTVLQEWFQPMSDGKRRFIVGSFLCYSYKLILISPGIFHRALFEKPSYNTNIGKFH